MSHTEGDPYKKKEYDAFVAAISEGNVGHWVEIANALNVDKNTILAWKQLPEAQAAIQKGINDALEGMKSAGAKDWKMYEAKLKMLGINPATIIKATVDDPRAKVLNKYMGEKDAGETQETESRSSEDSA